MATTKKDNEQKKSIIAALIDRSGSMGSIKDDTEGGLKSFIEDQKKDQGEQQIKMTLHEFDTEYNEVYGLTDIDKVPDYELLPRGMTALVDALGYMLNTLEETVKKEEPDNVIVLVFTDGMENSSKEYSLDSVKKKIETLQKEKNWEFLFLGANIDAVKVGGSFGFSPHSSMTYGANAGGVSATYEAVSSYTRSIRVGDVTRAGFTEEERSRAMGD